jgi:RimJ/RimL family protein N-acetyltransferase
MGIQEIPVLLTERLRLRAFCAGDLDDYAALKADPEVLRHLLGAGREPWDRGRAFRHMAFLLGAWQLGGTGSWAVELRETGAFIGVIGFSEPQGWPGFELAWALVRRFWGNGYATEGARAALDHAFGVWGREHVISLIHPENRASIRVAERLGQRLEGPTEVLGQKVLRYGIERAATAWPCPCPVAVAQGPLAWAGSPATR